MNKHLFYILFLFIISSFNTMAQDKTDMQKLLWIVDKWKYTGNHEVTIEEWIKVNDDLYEGSTKTVLKGEDVFSEKLKIENTSDGIFYVADVKHNPEPVKFKLTEVNDSLAVFENPEHDFPKKITYSYDGGNLHAFIEGPGKDGTTKKIDFYMLKMR